jgi:putative membrane protein
MPSSLRDAVRYLLFGLLMGGADIIPGVSGGTMALIVGVYTRLIASISDLFAFGLNLLRLNLAEARRHWGEVYWGLVLPLGVGIVAALKLGALVIPDLMARYPMRMNGLFLGLVAGSLLIPWLKMDARRAAHVAVMAGAAALAFWLTGLPTLETAARPGLVRVFLSASVAICAMILPGVSGAFLLKVLGLYEPTLEALNAGDWAYVVTFCAGAGLGLGSFALVLDWLLSRVHDWTMAALIGLIAGALRALWPFVADGGALRLPTEADPVLAVVVLAVLGFGGVVGLTLWGLREEDAEAGGPYRDGRVAPRRDDAPTERQGARVS